MKILVIGCRGQVGSELMATLACVGSVVGIGRSEVDVADHDKLRRVIREASPDLIVNASAYNEVDRAEVDEKTAFTINCESVALMGEEMKKTKGGLIHYSTDFVFDGKIDRPYKESDSTNPLSRYGASKLAGEQALSAMKAPAIVLRTAWVWSVKKKSFVSTMLRLAREKSALDVVSDQIGSPTNARDLAQATGHIIYNLRHSIHKSFRKTRGVYHAVGDGFCSRYEFAQEILKSDPYQFEHKVKSLNPVSTEKFKLPALRPTFAPLDCGLLESTFGIKLPHWRDSLHRDLT